MDLTESWTYGDPPGPSGEHLQARVQAEKEVSRPFGAQAEAATGPALPRMWRRYASQKAWQTQAKPAVPAGYLAAAVGPWAAAPMPWCAVPAQWGVMPGPWAGMPGAWSGLPGPWAGGPGPWGKAPAPCGAPKAPCGAVKATWGAPQVPWGAPPATWQAAPAPYARQAVKRKGVGPYARSTLAIDAAVGLDVHTDPMQP